MTLWQSIRIPPDGDAARLPKARSMYDHKAANGLRDGFAPRLAAIDGPRSHALGVEPALDQVDTPAAMAAIVAAPSGSAYAAQSKLGSASSPSDFDRARGRRTAMRWPPSTT